MRLLVCGGRHYSDYVALYRILDAIHVKCGVSVVISGAARGADGWAAHWAKLQKIPLIEFPADWKAHGKKAGPLRNQKMLDDGRPDGVVAFPGGWGTMDMKNRAMLAGVKIWEPIPSP